MILFHFYLFSLMLKRSTQSSRSPALSCGGRIFSLLLVSCLVVQSASTNLESKSFQFKTPNPALQVTLFQEQALAEGISFAHLAKKYSLNPISFIAHKFLDI